jgi:hypothetical protein
MLQERWESITPGASTAADALDRRSAGRAPAWVRRTNVRRGQADALQPVTTATLRAIALSKVSHRRERHVPAFVANLPIDGAKRMLIRFTKSYYLAPSTLFDLALSAKNQLSQPVSAYDDS